MSKLPFEGIRVADFGWIITAPLGTAWLATMGAEVIKVESKVHPDTLRSGIHGGAIPGEDPAFNCTGGFNSLNYSKYSCCLDMTKPEAQELAYEIIKTSDMVVEAYTAPVVERFGLTFPQLQAIKPDIILVSVSSLGKTGPLKDVTGFGPANQAFASLPSMMGYPGGPPASMGGTWPDYVMGVAMAYLAVAGLYHRKRTGQGIYLDLSMAEAVMDMIPGQLLDYTMNGRVAQPQGNMDDLAAPHNVYRCEGDDKWVAISVHDETQWAAFCQAAGHPEWRDDERFSDIYKRRENRAELDALIREWTLPQSGHSIMEQLQAVGVPAGPSQDTLELMDDPQLQHRNQFFEMDNPHTGPRLSMAMQGIFSAIPERRYSPAPAFDRDNNKVFHDILGLSEDKIARLVEEGVIN